MKVKAVLFDLGETLVRIWTPEIVFKRILDSLGVDRPVEEIREALARTDEQFNSPGYRSLYGKTPYQEYWGMWSSTVLKNLGIPGYERLAGEIVARWFEHADCEAYPDAEETLVKLRRMGLKTGLVSTGYEKDVYAILEKSGLQKELFDVIVGADTIGMVKPHPEAFNHALEKLRVKPEEALFIGDKTDDDYMGAEGAGITPILIRREAGGTSKASGLRTVTSLREIFQFI
ncbi:MAG: HAD family hydrolase [Candidatus Brockarchaeota archaeon]|nr:HAD family hydrolase [Candidatus Brockarchaeota archaeon]